MWSIKKPYEFTKVELPLQKSSITKKAEIYLDPVEPGLPLKNGMQISCMLHFLACMHGTCMEHAQNKHVSFMVIMPGTWNKKACPLAHKDSCPNF